MAEWLGQVSQGHEMYCHDIEVKGLNPAQAKLGCVVLLSELYLNQTHKTRILHCYV